MKSSSGISDDLKDLAATAAGGGEGKLVVNGWPVTMVCPALALTITGGIGTGRISSSMERRIGGRRAGSGAVGGGGGTHWTAPGPLVRSRVPRAVGPEICWTGPPKFLLADFSLDTAAPPEPPRAPARP